MTVSVNRYIKFCYALCLISAVLFSACSASKEKNEEAEEDNKTVSVKESVYFSEVMKKIYKTASEEQQNPMYSRFKDSTYLYWLNNQLILLNNSTKCNIFALNVLYKAGFKCPEVNTLTYDLMDTLKFNDVFPYIGSVNDNAIQEKIRPGDLIIWNGHVIIFESLKEISARLYAIAWWAGTRQEDNGDNIINNVIHGKYPLEGYFIVRRPMYAK